MATGLSALEHSLKSRGSSQRARSKSSVKQVPPASGALPQDAATIAGADSRRSSRLLRSLERSLPARNEQKSPRLPPAGPVQSRRLDHGQAPVRLPALPAVTGPQSQNKITSTPVQEPVNSSFSNVVPQNYSPELSAPDTGRFQVEPFTTDIGDPGQSPIAPRADQPESPAAPVPAAPAVDGKDRSRQAEPAISQHPLHAKDDATAEVPPAGFNTPDALPAEEDDWFAQAGEQVTPHISQASRDALDTGTALAAEDFERDLASILGHKPTTGAGNTSPATSPAPDRDPVPPREPATSTAEEDEPAHPNHDVFDRMGLGMQYANSFDLGAVNLQERFDEFDRELAQPHGDSNRAVDAANPFVDPYAKPMELDEFDLIAELAEIGGENKRSAQQRDNLDQTIHRSSLEDEADLAQAPDKHSPGHSPGQPTENGGSDLGTAGRSRLPQDETVDSDTSTLNERTVGEDHE